MVFESVRGEKDLGSNTAMVQVFKGKHCSAVVLYVMQFIMRN
jgi:hypothetical protein